MFAGALQLIPRGDLVGLIRHVESSDDADEASTRSNEMEVGTSQYSGRN